MLAEYCTRYGRLPALVVEKIGYGAGTRDLPGLPNVLRAILGQATPELPAADKVAIVAANIDDLNPEFFGEVMDRLLSTGALDVFWTPVQMKKNRPGTLVTVLCETADTDRVAELLLTHTTSFGVRIHEARRRVLAREIVPVHTRYGEIAVKIGRLAGRIVQRAPEFEACRRAAAAAGVPVKTVYNEAANAAGDMQ